VNDLTLRNLRKEFRSHDGTGSVVAVNDANLEVPKGTLVTLLGPSGCGKTTLLRMIAGFEEPTSGHVLFGERDVTSDPPNRRNASMVFQSYAIFPHLNVFDNVAFGLKLQRLPAAQVRERVGRVMEVTGLSGYEKRSPSQLSGGQQQRVALARCIVMEPQLLLFDEPLSNLDAKLREQMRVEIRELQQRLGITTVYVTHDQVEAMSISDVVVVMEKGHIMQIGSPEDIYARPANHFVADFIGKANFAEAEVVDVHTVRVGGKDVQVQPHDFAAGQQVSVMLRPEAATIDRSQGQFEGTVKRAMFLGSVLECVVDVPGVGEMMIDVPNPVAFGRLEVGEKVVVTPVAGLPAVVAD
jgi:iron(III) transport system ATP-binding protein